MKRRWLLKSVLLTLVVWLSAGCVPGTPPVAEPGNATVSLPTTGKDSWETDWEKTVMAAKKEGTIIVASSMTVVVRDGLSKGLLDRHGIKMEVMSARPAQFVTRIQAERRSGIYSTDILVAGISTVFTTLVPAGDLEPLDQFLVIPEVKNESLWFEGRLRFVDKNHNLIGMVAVPKRPIALNTEAVKAGEIVSYRDLLNPKWKGKILIADPTIGGSGNATFHAIAEYIMDLNYLRELARQDPVIIRDDRLMAEWLARGKNPILLGYKEDIIAEFIAAGAPIAIMSPKEGTYATISGFGLSVMKNAPHPAATKLSVNWLLSKEGQTILSKTSLAQSLRVDVPKDHLPPEMRLNPEERYFWPDLDPDIGEKREHYRKVSQEIWGHLIK